MPWQGNGPRRHAVFALTEAPSRPSADALVSRPPNHLQIEKSHPIHPRNLEKKKKRTVITPADRMRFTFDAERDSHGCRPHLLLQIFAAQAAVVAPKPKPPAPKPVAKAPEPVAKLADVSADKKAL